MRYLLGNLDQLSEELESSYPDVSVLLDEAGSLLQASEIGIARDVDALAGQLRASLPVLDTDTSVQLAASMIQQYGSWTERDALPVPLLPSPTHRSGPATEVFDQYQPGQEQWWAAIDSDDFRPYRRTQIAELRPYRVGLDMTGVSVSEADRSAGSPRDGDMIARNPVNHADQWLVAADYFRANFEPADMTEEPDHE